MSVLIDFSKGIEARNDDRLAFVRRDNEVKYVISNIFLVIWPALLLEKVKITHDLHIGKWFLNKSYSNLLIFGCGPNLYVE